MDYTPHATVCAAACMWGGMALLSLRWTQGTHCAPFRRPLCSLCSDLSPLDIVRHTLLVPNLAT